jgi:WhiB family transcriptional regulator, redox-sensing transcriptional regulator
MSDNIASLSAAAFQGDGNPLLGEAEKARGKHWAEEANCTEADVDLFFPIGDGPREDPMESAERLGLSLVQPMNLCASCPLHIAARCLVDSIERDDEWGIRGGLLASERSALRATWQQRIDQEAVDKALRGATAPLSKSGREAVIERFHAGACLYHSGSGRHTRESTQARLARTQEISADKLSGAELNYERCLTSPCLEQTKVHARSPLPVPETSMPHIAPNSCADLLAAIHAVAPAAVLARVYPKWQAVAHVFQDDFHRALIGWKNEMAVAHLVRQKFADVADWRSPHDFHLPTGRLYIAPGPTQTGFVPEDDLTFGLAPARFIEICEEKTR